MQDDDTYLGAENAFNLFTVRRNADTATEEERARLDVVGEYHLGKDCLGPTDIFLLLSPDGESFGWGLQETLSTDSVMGLW